MNFYYYYFLYFAGSQTELPTKLGNKIKLVNETNWGGVELMWLDIVEAKVGQIEFVWELLELFTTKFR